MGAGWASQGSRP
nr:unnamed protein product [Digitaria exilis]